MTPHFSQTAVARIFVAPAMAAIAIVLAIPLAYSLYASTTAWTLTRPATRSIGVGIDNFVSILADPAFWSALAVTAQYTVACVLIQSVVGLLMALLFNQRFLGRGLMRTLALLPMVATPAVVAIFWKLFYEENTGLFNNALTAVGLAPVPWLNAQWALASIVIMDTWQSAPFFMLVMLAGLQTMDESIVEAAKIDGAGPWQITRFLTLPHLAPYVVIAAAFRSITAMSEFDRMYLLTQGGPGTATTSVSLFAYNTGFKVFDIGRTSASSWIVLVLTLVLTAPLVAHLLRGNAVERG